MRCEPGFLPLLQRPVHGVRLATARLPVSEDGSVEAVKERLARLSPDACEDFFLRALRACDVVEAEVVESSFPPRAAQMPRDHKAELALLRQRQE
eukprot:759507-Hanusia_phi.AAC.2